MDEDVLHDIRCSNFGYASWILYQTWQLPLLDNGTVIPKTDIQMYEFWRCHNPTILVLVTICSNIISTFLRFVDTIIKYYYLQDDEEEGTDDGGAEKFDM